VKVGWTVVVSHGEYHTVEPSQASRAAVEGAPAIHTRSLGALPWEDSLVAPAETDRRIHTRTNARSPRFQLCRIAGERQEVATNIKRASKDASRFDLGAMLHAPRGAIGASTTGAIGSTGPSRRASGSRRTGPGGAAGWCNQPDRACWR
jgi:hypothetical protein